MKERSFEAAFPDIALRTSFAEAVRVVAFFSLGNATFELNAFLAVGLFYRRM